MGMILQKIALSKWGQRLYKHAADPKNQKFWACTLPTAETALATICYCWATHKQKNIDHDRKMLLQWQNIGSGVVGIGVGSYLNRKVYNWGERLIPKLDPKLIPDVHKVINGIRVLLPITVTAIAMRVAIPSVIAWFSGKAEEVRRSKRDEKSKKLNVVA